ncbi:fas-binding factor 1 homolog [Pungitius pungitius]|uniref:fas-binding factor 1 homolog n=1 Tax=Pungitius pungitius TaxID=134920 RepID=UPI002E15136A
MDAKKGKLSKAHSPDLPVRRKATRSGPLTRTSATDNIFSMLAEEVKRDGDTEDSDVSAADPNDILKNLKDMDDMDADIFAPQKKPSSAPARTKPLGNEGLRKESSALESTLKPEGADEPAAVGRRTNSAPSSTANNHKKFTFSDADDALAALDDLLPDETTAKPQTKMQLEKPAPSPSASPVLKTETSTAATRRSGLTFDDDDEDDLMDALGFESDRNKPKKKDTMFLSNGKRSEIPPRPRTKLDEILKSSTSTRLLERPPTGERKDQEPARVPPLEDSLTFGAYQPTMGSPAEERQSRRQSVRFSTEDVGPSTPEKKPKAATTPPSARRRSSADWLGLKTRDDQTLPVAAAEEAKTSPESPPSPSPSPERRPSLTGGQADKQQTRPEAPRGQQREEEGALSGMKATWSREAQTPRRRDSPVLGGDSDVESTFGKPAPRSREDPLSSARDASSTFLGGPGPSAHPAPVGETTRRDGFPPPTGPRPVSAASVSHAQPQPLPHHLPSHKGPGVPSQASHETLQQLPALQQQVTLSADSLQQLLLQQQMMHHQFLGLGSVVDRGALQEREQHPGDLHASQARIIQLEGQMKTLQLEREQSQMLLEKVQHQHKQDMELMENAHKSRVKLLEESAAQREAQARKECEDLAERLSGATRSAEQERSQLQAQYQRKVAQAQQDRDREVERLRDLQRKSILEMKRDHEEQLQRLKKLKDEEIDAVTSATSQTRSLTVVMEQMEHFSSRLGDLSSRVESTHEHAAHGLEQGARQRDEQLRMMQDRLAQQQKAMAEERVYLKDIISRMDAQLSEQQRQLEKERWKVTAEQAKAESTQRAVEGERHALSLQINVEREELERAKSALLEEQKSVMQRCAEERRKLAADWAHFHSLEKQRHDRAEREVSSLLEKRGGSIVSLAQEQADLKLHGAELRQKEVAASQERGTLDRLREELDREKERISSAAVRLKTRAHEVEAFSELAAEKYEEGERALREAKRLEAEHEARLRNIHSQAERLRQQEQRILQERRRLSHLQEEPERLRPNAAVASTPRMIAADRPDAGSFLPNPELSSILNDPPPAPSASSRAMALQASLALWKYTAEKDREYLQEEQIFLENLKKKAYRSTFNAN